MSTEIEWTLSAPIFCDCTGNGTLGYMAGVPYRTGSESKSEFNESHAPDASKSRDTALLRSLCATMIYYLKRKEISSCRSRFAETTSGSMSLTLIKHSVMRLRCASSLQSAVRTRGYSRFAYTDVIKSQFCRSGKECVFS